MISFHRLEFKVIIKTSYIMHLNSWYLIIKSRPKQERVEKNISSEILAFTIIPLFSSVERCK